MTTANLRKSAEERHIPIIKEAAEKLLCTFVEVRRPQKILEIGTAVGYSGAAMLSCGDPSSRLYTIEIDEVRYNEAKENFKELGFSPRVTQYLGDAREIIESITGSYDLIFVDGPKGQYVHFLPYLLKVLNCGGIMICDNVLYRGLVDGSVKMRRHGLTLVTNLRSFLQKIQSDTSLYTALFEGIGDGMSVRVKKLQGNY